MTVFVRDEDEGICSRNHRVFRPDLASASDAKNSFVEVALREGLLPKLRLLHRNVAAQGELLGPGVQGNPYRLPQAAFFCFDLFDIDSRQYIEPAARREICRQIGLKQVPLLDEHRLGRSGKGKVRSALVIAKLFCVCWR